MPIGSLMDCVQSASVNVTKRNAFVSKMKHKKDAMVIKKYPITSHHKYISFFHLYLACLIPYLLLFFIAVARISKKNIANGAQSSSEESQRTTSAITSAATSVSCASSVPSTPVSSTTPTTNLFVSAGEEQGYNTASKKKTSVPSLLQHITTQTLKKTHGRHRHDGEQQHNNQQQTGKQRSVM